MGWSTKEIGPAQGVRGEALCRTHVVQGQSWAGTQSSKQPQSKGEEVSVGAGCGREGIFKLAHGTRGLAAGGAFEELLIKGSGSGRGEVRGDGRGVGEDLRTHPLVEGVRRSTAAEDGALLRGKAGRQSCPKAGRGAVGGTRRRWGEQMGLAGDERVEAFVAGEGRGWMTDEA